jgi:hypothetical protein
VKSDSDALKLRSILSQVLVYRILKDTAQVTHLFQKGFKTLENSILNYNQTDVISFKLEHIEYQIRREKITANNAIARCQELYNILDGSENYKLITEIVGRLSLLHRNKKELGEALNYNLLEQEYARKSNQPRELAAAMITELDLSYQLLPKPAKSEYVTPLIEKAQAAEMYMRENEIFDILPFAKLYLAKFYIQENNYQKSEEILISIEDSTSSSRVVFSKYEHLSEIAKSTNDFDSYRAYTLKFKPVAYSTKRPFVALNVHNYLLDYFVKTNQKDSAIFYAYKLEQNLREVDTTQFLDYLRFSYNVLSDHYFEIDKDKSYLYRTYANTLNEQIVAKQKESLVNIIKYRDDIQNLKSENIDLYSSVSFFKKNFNLILVISIILIGIVIYLIFVYKKTKASSKLILKEKSEIIKKTERKNIVLNNKQKIYLDEVEFIKSDRNYVEFYMATKKIIDRNNLKNTISKLPPNFVQVHRSYVVNKNFIKVANSNNLIMKSQVEIPISRTFKKNIISI